MQMRCASGYRPDDASLDCVVWLAACPHGHPASSPCIVSEVACPSVDACVEQWRSIFFREAGGRDRPGSCRECGSLLDAANGTVYLASWLAQARQDLLMRFQASGRVALALWDHEGDPVSVEPDHAAMREFAASSHMRSALSLLSLGEDPVGCRRALADVTDRWPEYAPAMKAMAFACKASGDTAEAARWAERAAACTPGDAEAHFACGDILDETGEEGRALEAYDRAIALDTRHVMAWVQRGMVLRRLGRVADAIESYQAALDIHPHLAVALNSMAIAWFSQGKGDRGAEFLARIRPSDLGESEGIRRTATALALSRGQDLAREKKWVEAARQFELAASFSPQEAHAWRLWALCLYSVGAAGEACLKVRRALELDPTLEQERGLLPVFEQAARELEALQGDGGLVAMHSEHAFRYHASLGVEATVLAFEVKIETSKRYLETSAARLSLEDDLALLKLLVAKGHNLRVEQGLEGRPMAFMLEVAPAPEFATLAAARTWTTARGKKVESAPAALFKGVTGECWEAPASPPDGFVLDRALEMERPGVETFFPGNPAVEP